MESARTRSRCCRTRISRALHETGCASRGTGWQPRFLTAWDAVGADRRDAAVRQDAQSMANTCSTGHGPMPIGRYGRRYYPKLVAAIPFTPVPGAAPARATTRATRRALLDARARRAARDGYSSLHVLFADEAQAREVRGGRHADARRRAVPLAQPRLPRLRRFPRRRSITTSARRSGRSGAGSPRRASTFVRKVGAEIGAADWAFFFDCYERTYRAHHSTPYLSLDFFDAIGATLRRASAARARLSRTARRLCAALDVFDAARRCGDATGARANTCRACISRRATTRRSNSASSAASTASKAARRACTSSRAGCCRSLTHSLHAIADRSVRRGDRRLLRARAHRRRALDRRTGIGQSVSRRPAAWCPSRHLTVRPDDGGGTWSLPRIVGSRTASDNAPRRQISTKACGRFSTSARPGSGGRSRWGRSRWGRSRWGRSRNDRQRIPADYCGSDPSIGGNVIRRPRLRASAIASVNPGQRCIRHLRLRPSSNATANYISDPDLQGVTRRRRASLASRPAVQRSRSLLPSERRSRPPRREGIAPAAGRARSLRATEPTTATIFMSACVRVAGPVAVRLPIRRVMRARAAAMARRCVVAIAA